MEAAIFVSEWCHNHPIRYALFQYMIYTWVQNYTHIESFFNKILNVKHG